MRRRTPALLLLAVLLGVGCTSGDGSADPPGPPPAADDGATADATPDQPRTSPTPAPPDPSDPDATTVTTVGEPLGFTTAPVEGIASTGQGFHAGGMVHDGERFVLVGQRDGPEGQWLPTVLTSTDGVDWERLAVPDLPPAVLYDVAVLPDGRVVVAGSLDGRGRTPGLLAIGGSDGLEPVDDPALAPPGGLALFDLLVLPDGELLALGSTVTEALDDRLVALRSQDGTTWEVDEELGALVADGVRPAWAGAAVVDGDALVLRTAVDGDRRRTTALVRTASGWERGETFGGDDVDVRVEDVVQRPDGSVLAVGGTTRRDVWAPAVWVSRDGLDWRGRGTSVVVDEDHTSSSSFGELLTDVVQHADGSLTAAGYFAASNLVLHSPDGVRWDEVPLPAGTIDTEMPAFGDGASDGTRAVLVGGGDAALLVDVAPDAQQARVRRPDALPAQRIGLYLDETSGYGPDTLVGVEVRVVPSRHDQLQQRTNRVVEVGLDGAVRARSAALEDQYVGGLDVDPEGRLVAAGYDLFDPRRDDSLYANLLVGPRPEGLDPRTVRQYEDEVAPRFDGGARLTDGTVVAVGSTYLDGSYAPRTGVLEDGRVVRTPTPTPALVQERLHGVCALARGGAVAIGQHSVDGRGTPTVWRSPDGRAWRRIVRGAAELGGPVATLDACVDGPDGVVLAGSVGNPAVGSLWTLRGDEPAPLALPDVGQDPTVHDMDIGADGALWVLASGDDGARRVRSLVRLEDGAATLVQPLLGGDFRTPWDDVAPGSVVVVGEDLVLVSRRADVVTLHVATGAAG